MASPTLTPTSLPKADSGARIIAFLIDSLIAFPIGLIGLIPIIGQLISTSLLVPYWLLRDADPANSGGLGVLVTTREFGSVWMMNRVLYDAMS